MTAAGGGRGGAQWKPRVTVAAVIERDQRFLLVEESIDGKQVYNQPAGHLEAGESLLQAARREAREETGRRFTPEYLIGVYLFTAEDGETYLRFCFSGDCGEPDPAVELDEGIVRAVWMSRQQLARHQDKLRTRLVLECIDDYLAGRRQPLDLLRFDPGPRAAR